MATNNDHTSDREEFPRLVRDLRSMPRVQAPSNLEYLLEQRIHSGRDAKSSWWKRFFLSGFNIGGLRIPAYAYGPVAAAVIVAAGLYVFNASDFNSQLEHLDKGPAMHQQPAPPSQQPPQPSPQSQQPLSTQQPPSPQPTQPAIQPQPEPKRQQEAAPAPSDNAPAAKQSSERRAAKPAPATVPSAGGKNEYNGEDMMPRTRGLPDEETQQPKKAAEQGRVNTKTNALHDAAPSKEKQLLRKSDALQEQMYIVAPSAVRDSARILNSLRRLDSLRRLGRKP